MTRLSASTQPRKREIGPPNAIRFRRQVGMALGLVTAVLIFIHPISTNAATIEVELRDGQISPSQMTISVNKPLSIHVTNRGTKAHNLVIPDFFVFTQNLAPGKDVRVEFAPSKQGKFPYYSDTGGKPETGMQGTLTVSP